MVDPSQDDARDQPVEGSNKQSPLRSRLRRLWNDTGRPLQIAWITLWTIGLILLAFGIWGDITKFWADKPYLTNVVSSLTGAAFGIPLALIILQRVAAGETDAAEARAAHRMAVRVSRYLAAATRAVIEGNMSAEEVISKIQSERVLLDNSYNTIPTRAQIVENFTRDHNNDLQLESYISLLEEVSTGKFWNPRIAEILGEVSLQWSILSTVCRPRLLETGGKWLNGTEERKLNKLVEKAIDSDVGTLLQEGSDLLRELRRFMDRFRRLPAGKVEIDKLITTLAKFSLWLLKMIPLLDAMADLISLTANTERFLAAQD